MACAGLLSLLALQVYSSTCAGDFGVQGRRGDCVASQPEIAGRASATAGCVSIRLVAYLHKQLRRNLYFCTSEPERGARAAIGTSRFAQFTCVTGLFGLLVLLVRTRAGRTCRYRNIQQLTRRSQSNRLRTSVCGHLRIHRYRVMCPAEARLYFSGSIPRRAFCVSICTLAPAAASAFELLY